MLFRAVRREDFETIAFIKNDASRLFGDDYSSRPLERSVFEDYLTHGESVAAVDAEDRPVGYALGHEEEGDFYLHQLFVSRAYGHQGLGTVLLKDIIEKAKDLGLRAVTLTTGGTLPFNAPFYSRHGFVVLEPSDMPACLRTRLEVEIEHFSPGNFPWIKDHPEHLPRVAMERVLSRD